MAKTCEKGHQNITYYGNYCPLCAASAYISELLKRLEDYESIKKL